MGKPRKQALPICGCRVCKAGGLILLASRAAHALRSRQPSRPKDVVLALGRMCADRPERSARENHLQAEVLKLNDLYNAYETGVRHTMPFRSQPQQTARTPPLPKKHAVEEDWGKAPSRMFQWCCK
ncbi:unnamed protein product [Symbiodinium natans]|uniref:Uncharacterized protein n=1 Tax=Symbiodinium natans TaxID=878477 RepID=A0A812KDE5_9DINO|nr:unnamed protein product [Symbiodinium natans]